MQAIELFNNENKQNNKNNVSITKILLLFYMLVGTSLLQPLLSKQWVSTIKNNRLIQHAIGFSTMLTLFILIFGDQEEYSNLVLYTILGYVWFLFSTKMDIHLNLIITLLLLGNYIYTNYIKYENKKIESDNILSEDAKYHLINNNLKKDNYLMFGLMALIVGGMFMYSDKKEVQYGGGYSVINFLLY